MARLAFLFLVVTGALAVLVALFVGMGLYQAAKLQEPPVAPSATTRPSTTAPAATRPAVAVPRSEERVVAAVEPPPKVAVPVAAPEQPLTLLAKDAILVGEDVRLDPAVPGTIVNWSNRRDGLEWTAQVPAAGLYDVEMTYACDRTDGGGVFSMRAGVGSISASVRPTGGWEDYQSQYIGKMYLPQGPTALYIRPVYMMPGGRLMNLRAVTLKFVKQIEAPQIRVPFPRRQEF